jgi:hypothetical protein
MEIGSYDWKNVVYVPSFLRAKDFPMSMPFYRKDKASVPRTSRAGGVSLYAILAWLFAVDEREALDAKTGGDKSNGRWTWGL